MEGNRLGPVGRTILGIGLYVSSVVLIGFIFNFWVKRNDFIDSFIRSLLVGAFILLIVLCYQGVTWLRARNSRR